MSQKHLSDRQLGRENGQNAYRAITAVSAASLLFAAAFSAYPLAGAAFWPFSLARAEGEGEPPIVHDPSEEWLQSAVHVDPNPDKGETEVPMSEGSALFALSGPAGALPSAKGVAAADVSYYEVREGDSLSEIADMFGVSIATIRSANDLESSTIQPGDTLKILPVSGVVYKIKRGGTLSDVAELFGVDVAELTAANGIDANDALAVGTELIVPGGTELPEKKSAPKSSSSSGVAVVKKTLPALSGYFGNPVPSAYVSQGVHGHNGIDLAGIPQGTPVYAAAAGTVTEAESGGLYNGGYGNYVDVVHDNGTKTRYAHLSSVSVVVGQTVEKGEQLGGVGNTGRSTGYHLHFEVHGAQNPFAQ